MDYRRRWQITRRKRFRTRMLVFVAVCVVAAAILLLGEFRRPSDLVWVHTPPEPGLVHFTAGEGRLLAVWQTGHTALLDLRSGSEYPQFAFRRPVPLVGLPLLMQGQAVFGADDGRVHCVELQSGRALWEQRTGAAVRARPVYTPQGLLIGSDDGYLYCLDPGTGTPRWRTNLGGRIGVEAAVTDSRAVVGTVSSGILGVEIASGLTPPAGAHTELFRRKWKVPTEGPVLGVPVVYAPGRVVLGSDQGTVRFLRVEDGAELARVKLSGLVRARPIVAGGQVVLADDLGQVVALDHEGQLLWTRRIAEGVSSGLAASAEAVYLATAEGELVALRLTDGRRVWRRQLPGPAAGTLELAEGLLLVGLVDGRICAFRLPG